MHSECFVLLAQRVSATVPAGERLWPVRATLGFFRRHRRIEVFRRLRHHCYRRHPRFETHRVVRLAAHPCTQKRRAPCGHLLAGLQGHPCTLTLPPAVVAHPAEHPHHACNVQEDICLRIQCTIARHLLSRPCPPTHIHVARLSAVGMKKCRKVWQPFFRREPQTRGAGSNGPANRGEGV